MHYMFSMKTTIS